jgi:hypothetical protein
VDEVFADIDAGREYWREGDSVVHSVLSYITGAGFGDFFKQYDLPQTTALEFRQRHLINLLKANRGIF